MLPLLELRSSMVTSETFADLLKTILLLVALVGAYLC
jgi:hypothetical protein